MQPTWVLKSRLLRRTLYVGRVNLRRMAPATLCVISTERSTLTGSAYFAAAKQYTSAMEHTISAKDAMMSSLVSLIRAKFNCEIAKVQPIAHLAYHTHLQMQTINYHLSRSDAACASQLILRKLKNDHGSSRSKR